MFWKNRWSSKIEFVKLTIFCCSVNWSTMYWTRLCGTNLKNKHGNLILTNKKKTTKKKTDLEVRSWAFNQVRPLSVEEALSQICQSIRKLMEMPNSENSFWNDDTFLFSHFTCVLLISWGTNKYTKTRPKLYSGIVFALFCDVFVFVSGFVWWNFAHWHIQCVFRWSFADWMEMYGSFRGMSIIIII